MILSTESPMRSVFILIGTGALVMIAFFGWRDLYTQYFELVKPSFEVIEKPRGISTNPVNFKVIARDKESGLDEIDIKLVQGPKVTQILAPTKVDGAYEQEINLTISPSTAPLLPGKAKFVFNAADKSIWGMASSIELDLMVDYAKPTLDLVDAPQAIAQGDMRLVFYRVTDEDLSESGILVGDTIILGFPARLLDPVFNQDNLYVVPFILPLESGTDNKIKIFAEDRSGNASTLALDTIQIALPNSSINVNLSENMLRGITSRVSGQSLEKLETYYKHIGETIPSPEKVEGNSYLLHLFSLFNGKLREITRKSLAASTNTFRAERYWQNPLIASGSAGQITFASNVKYYFKEQELGSYREFSTQRIVKTNDKTVVSAAKGVVQSVDNLSSYGRTIVIDHGLGVITLYCGLTEILVRPGEEVDGARAIGTATVNQDTNTAEFYFSVIVSGIPTNPIQWTNSENFKDKVARPINAVKRKLGLPVVIE